MPSDYVGDCGIGDLPRERWLVIESLRWGVDYLRRTVGEPEGYVLDILWKEHELGDYPYIGVTWSDGHSAPPSDFMWKWERALKIFDEAIDWTALHPGNAGARVDNEWKERQDEQDDEGQ